MSKRPKPVDSPEFRVTMEATVATREAVARKLAVTSFRQTVSLTRTEQERVNAEKPWAQKEAEVRSLATSIAERAQEKAIPFDRVWVVSRRALPGFGGKDEPETRRIQKMRERDGGKVLMVGWLLNEPVVAHGATPDHSKLRSSLDHILLPYDPASPQMLLAFNDPNPEKNRFSNHGHGHHATHHGHYDPRVIPVYNETPEESLVRAIRPLGVKASIEVWEEIEQGLAHFARKHNLPTPLALPPAEPTRAFPMPPIG